MLIRHSIPESVQFDRRDIEESWRKFDHEHLTLKLGFYDLVHLRMLNGSISNWSNVYAEAFR